MTSSWLPQWLGVAWSVVYLAVLATHLSHLVGASRRHQAWHATHVLMALGMLDMYWPGARMPVGAGVGVVVFGIGLAGVLAVLVVDLRQQPGASAVWLVTAVDLAGMIVMFWAMSHSADLLAKVLICWFAVETVGWVTGYLSPDDVLPLRLSVASTPIGAASAGPGQPISYLAAADTGAPSAGTASAEPDPPTQTVATTGGNPFSTLVTRLSLVLMSLGMAYMFLLLQVGGTAGGMPGMS